MSEDYLRDRADRRFAAQQTDQGLPRRFERQPLESIALVQPIAPALEAAHAKTLMLVLHDTLRYVPFAALQDGKHYLIESMAVVNVNQASRDKLASKSQSDWQIWGLGVTKQGADYPALPFTGEELNDIKAALGGRSQVKLDQDFTESGLRGGLGGTYQVIHIASHSNSHWVASTNPCCYWGMVIACPSVRFKQS